MKRKKKEQGALAAQCQLRSGDVHPFGAMRAFTPLGGGEERVYREMREAIPVLDAAVSFVMCWRGMCPTFLSSISTPSLQRQVRWCAASAIASRS